MTARRLWSKLRRSTRAVAALEFAIAAPVILLLLFGTIQIAFVMQAYNSMRGVSGAISRYAVVQYMNGNKLSDTQIETALIAQATGEVYRLNGESLDVTAATDATNTMAGVKKIDITLDYTVPRLIPLIPVSAFRMTFGRSIYVYDKAAITPSL